MAYKARDGRYYSHKETPREYLARKRRRAKKKCPTPSQSGLGILVFGLIIAGLVLQFWEYILGAVILATGIYVAYTKFYCKSLPHQGTPQHTRHPKQKKHANRTKAKPRK